MMKNGFYFALKAFSVLKIFKFLSFKSFWSCKKWLDQELNFKIYDPTAWFTNGIHVLPDITRSNDNQTRKFGHLIEYKHENHFP